MRNPLLLICISLITLMFLYSGCDEYGDEVLAPYLDPNSIFLKDTCDVDLILFQQQILPVIVRECASSGCHDAETRKANIALDNYKNIIQLISSEDSTESRLIAIINQLSSDPHTPSLNLEELTPLEIQNIDQWIVQGGLNTNCNSYCEFTEVNISDITLNDRNSPDNVSDDFYSFNIFVKGANLSQAYKLSLGKLDTIGFYNRQLDLLVKRSNIPSDGLVLTLTDTEKSQCVYSKRLRFPVEDTDTTVTETDTCKILDHGLNNIQCNDNQTPDNEDDDVITFYLNPTGNSTGTTYTLSGEGYEESGRYGQNTEFTLPQGLTVDEKIMLTLSDTDSAGCTLAFTLTDPGPCTEAPTCQLIQAGLSDISCNNNGTPNDTTDDFITFVLNPTGTALSDDGYLVTGAGIDDRGIYGQATVIATPKGSAGKGDLTLTLQDNDSSNCTIEVMVSDPGVCTEGPSCNLTQAGLTDVQCNDNDTPDDASDDYITFSLNPMGTAISGNYALTGGGMNVIGTYGQVKQFATPDGSAGQGDITFTLADADSTNCTFEFTLTDPGACTPPCNILNAGLADIACNDNSTPNDPTDDFMSFSLTPTGLGTGNRYQISGKGGLSGTGTYGQKQTFNTPQGTAGQGDLVITLTDGESPTCTFEVTLTDPGTCTPPCDIDQANLSNIDCNDNGTPGDVGDDYITFSLVASAGASNGMFTVTGGGITASGTYGQMLNLQSPAGSAGKGDITLIIRDTLNSECTASLLLVDPGSCANVASCNISNSGLNNITCNDNGTPLDNSDDFLTFDINPTGGGLGTNYYISGRGVDLQGQYGNPVSFSLPKGSIGTYDIELTITDGADNSCAIKDTLNDPYTCESCEVSNISYSQDIAPIMKDYCTSCHGGDSPQAGIKLSTYEDLKAQAERQRFYGSIIHDQRYSSMPPGGKMIPCEIKAIKEWIDQGMPNN